MTAALAELRIADTFTSGLGRLTAEEQKLVKTTAFDLQLNPANPGHQFHKLDRAKDQNFWSVRVSSDIRIIVHRTDASLLLCYVAHHDDAYRWAERRKLETHPRTGAAQLVEIRETVQEILIPKFIQSPATEPQAPTPKPALFASRSEDEILGYGVPPEWLQDVLAANEDTLLQLADHIPAEAAEALLELATGGNPQPRLQLSTTDQQLPTTDQQPATSPFSHPDAQRRFRVVDNVEELERALEYPWDRWAVFLHPAQRELVAREFAGPARVSGTAGTGKTVVALHRAVHLARTHEEASVLLTTFSPALAKMLRSKILRLVGGEPHLAERIDICDLDDFALRLYAHAFGKAKIAAEDQVWSRLHDILTVGGSSRASNRAFFMAEWTEVIDAWQLRNWEEYRDVRRLGRKTRLPESERANLWPFFEKLLAKLDEDGLVTIAGMYRRLSEHVGTRKHPALDFAVVDEAQDISIAQLRFLAAASRPQATPTTSIKQQATTDDFSLTPTTTDQEPSARNSQLATSNNQLGTSNALFFAGDLGQRIFRQPFSWLSLGVDIRGRSKTLTVNYRTSHQIRTQADRLLSATVSDIDGIVEDRRGVVSVFNGPQPEIFVAKTEADEIAHVAGWLASLSGSIAPSEICLIVRSEAQLGYATGAAGAAALPHTVLDHRAEPVPGHLCICTMHTAKGLEFRAVAIMACEDEIIPLQDRIESVADESDLEEVYNTERHLLYVACTRARDHLLISSAGTPSEFLDELRPRG